MDTPLIHVFRLAAFTSLVCCLVMLAACAHPIAVGLPCTVGPIILDKNDTLTRSTAEQIVTLNESGAVLCRWRAPKQ